MCYAAAFLAVTGPCAAETPATDPLVARVEGVEIRQSDLALAEETLGRTVPAQEDAKREYLISFLSDMIMLAKAAQSRQVADEADLQRRMTFVRNKALMDRILEVTGDEAVTDDTVRKAYEDVVLSAPAEPELHLRSILFRFPDPNNADEVKAAEDKAKAAIKRIAGGEDFAAVAREVTENPSGKTTGGDMGYMTRSQMGQEYADVALKLEKGAVSAPIKTQFGWHVIKVEDQRNREPVAFETVRDRLEVVVARKAQIELINRLRAEAKVERIEPAEQAEKPVQASQPAKPSTKP
ncbi:peptidylprolyl isomerase [Blastochloris tepida]|uniref:Parvulin-like PPIase n=1 Tax=Blastochloris tepida TaxID=2233851 RepID=A0A348FZY0_9HYPH|nr:peptidylprolyl isomerase [Blastochloris tepida]BBF92863.1 peptidylprolyl isomerase [Blastochloris tepida]